MYKNEAYYFLKSFIPRRLQLAIRQQIVRRKLAKYRHVWPIDENSAKPPEGWTGWPEGKKFALVITHDVESVKGLEKCRQLAETDKNIGFKSSFNFVAEDYKISPELRNYLTENGFEIGIHGLQHDNNLFRSEKILKKHAVKINRYLKEWDVAGFRAPSMYHNLDMIHYLNVEYDASTFDTDPFEPQPNGMETIFPFWVPSNSDRKGYVELPYTLPQDFLLFSLMKEKTIEIWKKKLDWIVENGGMALLIAHPDYMDFHETESHYEDYPVKYYKEFLDYIKANYESQYWNPLPKEMARFWASNFSFTKQNAKRKIRACMLAYTFYEIDGRVKRYAETLAKRGDDVDVIALRRQGQSQYEVINGVNIYRIQGRILNEKGKLSYLYRLVKFLINSSLFLGKESLRNSYDIIHVHSVPDFEVFAALLPKLTGSKIILDIHDIVPEFYASKFNVSKNSLVYKMLMLIEKASIAFSNHVIIANHIWKKTLTGRSVKEEKCTAILNYPDSSVFRKKTRAQQNDKLTIIYPGTLNWHQGIDIAVKAFARINDEFPDAEFHIYGEGPTENPLKELIEQLGLEKKIFIKPPLPIEQIAEVMANADLGVVPKRADTFGNEAYSTKILEFMTLGVPVLVSNTKIDRYYFDNSVVKFFNSGDEADLAESILTIVKNKKLKNRLTNNALKYAEENSWDVKKQVYIDIVDTLSRKSTY